MILNLKIGITGGLGLIGKALRAQLSSPVIFVSRQIPQQVLQANETCLVGSFADTAIAEALTIGPDVLVHAATAVGPRSEFEKQFIENDLVATIALAKTFFKNNPHGHFIYLSTAGGLYDLEDRTAKTEASPTDSKTIYGAIKLLIEESLERISGEYGVVTILRPAPIYGDSLKKNQTVGLIDKLLNSISGPVVSIFDNMESARDYLHVNDLIRAIKMVIQNRMKNQSASRFEIYNVGTGVETSILQVIETIHHICQQETHYEVLPVNKAPTSLIVNAEKLYQHVGWIAETTLDQGILKMYQDLQKRAVK
jgi:nucleoside-diphosphate-sugar epimerase